MVGLGGEALRELRGIAQLAGSDFGEDKPVVPLSAGLLQVLESGGEAAGSCGGFRGGLREIAGELGALADVVQGGGCCPEGLRWARGDGRVARRGRMRVVSWGSVRAIGDFGWGEGF